MLNINPNQVAVGNGSAELIKILSELLGRNYGLFKPTFEEYTATFENLTTELTIIKNNDQSSTQIYIHTHPENSRY